MVICVCVCAALALAVSALSSPARPAAPPVSRTAAIPPPIRAVVADPLDLDRLARYRSGAPVPTGARSPFEFDAGANTSPFSPSPDAGQLGPSDQPSASAAIAPEPPAPIFVGIAIADQAQGGERTAVFTTLDGTVEFGSLDAAVGAGRYRIRSLEPNSVTLVNTRTGELTLMILQ